MAIKLSRPFQSEIFAKRAYRELLLLKHMQHENVGWARGLLRGGRDGRAAPEVLTSPSVCVHTRTRTHRKIPQDADPTAPAEREPPPCSSGSLFLT